MMRTQKDKKSSALSKDPSSESQLLNEDSGSLSSLLGKRNSNDSSIDQLRADTDESREDLDNSLDPSDKRNRRLLQNRKSAKKCRLKKKAEYSCMKGDVNKLQDENKNLKERINEITIMLYQKMEENSNLQRKFEQAQLQQVVFLSQMMNQQSPLLSGLTGLGTSGQAAQANLNTVYQNAIGSAQQSQNQHSAGSGPAPSALQNQLMQMLQSSLPQQPQQQVDSRATQQAQLKDMLMNQGLLGAMNQKRNGPVLNPMMKGSSPMLSESPATNADLIELLKVLNQRKISEDSSNHLLSGKHILDSKISM